MIETIDDRVFPTNRLIQDVIGPDHPFCLGWDVLVQIFMDGEKHLKEDGTASMFDRPDSTIAGDAYRRGVGRILMMGDAAFTSAQFDKWVLRPRVGDWVNFGRNEGIFRIYNDVITLGLRDYNVIRIAQNPAIEGYHEHIGD